MQIVEDIAGLSRISGPVCLAIGVFDGLHRGHQAVIGEAVAVAEEVSGTAVVVTFDPHPRSVLSSKEAPRLLTSTAHKLVLMSAIGVSQVLLIRFDKVFSQLSGQEFICQLSEACEDLVHISVGKDWVFGKQRSGDLDLLKELGGELGFKAEGVIPVCEGDAMISSTAIRQAIQLGDFAAAKILLGRDYTVLGTVVKGNQLGRTIGYPTANLSVHNEQLPPSGVYAVLATRDAGRGSKHVALANLGYRPTVEGDQGRRLLEVFLLDFDEEIYGEDLEVTFVKLIREEKKFAGLGELKAQIAIDEEQVRQLEFGEI
ncbi:MAG: bifunctional riboflavin kinase/FAD synthetase [Verrucomicrobiales bacterium]|nr:bifunctional riboflavin kinase/FAD synthetase [Verrucomicrobiales bacterium]